LNFIKFRAQKRAGEKSRAICPESLHPHATFSDFLCQSNILQSGGTQWHE
jgi:hypothetical protein